MKFTNLFVDGEDQYLYVKTLGIGSEASAQLVIHAQTGQEFVRKVSKSLLGVYEKQKPDPERVLFRLHAHARLVGARPNIVHLFSAGDVPSSQRPEDPAELLYHRVGYFRFYNGGNLGDFLEKCITMRATPPPSFICKFIQETVGALSFMYSMNPYVLHGDLHIDNVFLHWETGSTCPDFYLGDWGWSTSGVTRAGNTIGLILDINQVWLHAQKLIGMQNDPDSKSALGQYLQAFLEPELRRLAFPVFGKTPGLPDLAPLLALLSAAPASTPPDLRPLREAQGAFLPRFYETWELAQRARGIHGPWHVAQVSVHPSTGKLTIIRISPETHHRPDLPSPSSEADNDDILRVVLLTRGITLYLGRLA